MDIYCREAQPDPRTGSTTGLAYWARIFATNGQRLANGFTPDWEQIKITPAIPGSPRRGVQTIGQTRLDVLRKDVDQLKRKLQIDPPARKIIEAFHEQLKLSIKALVHRTRRKDRWIWHHLEHLHPY